MAAMPDIVSPGQADPLAELRDIHLPTPIDAFLSAPGWWILAALLLLALVSLAWWIWRYWQKNRYRRDGIASLNQLREAFSQHQDGVAYVADYSRLLKRVALFAYPREEVASLTGEAWVSFLNAGTGSNEFSMGAGQKLVQGHYAPSADIDVDQLHQMGCRWIKKHSVNSQSEPHTRSIV